MENYDPKKIEPKWQQYWAEHPELYAAQDSSNKPKKYVLDMWPYPSGEGLHVGHVESYTATDILSRYFRMNNFNVLHPQGWDAFGLPAENFAIKTGVHPTETTAKAIATFKRQMKSMGFSYDWSRELNSSSPEYFKWTQWFFILLYKNGLAYKKKGKVNWCPSCQTVLANEQVEDGVCERCKNEVVQKDLEQWYFKITDFIEKNGNTVGLLEGLEKVDWPESIKHAQKNWIGKSEGAEFEFSISGSDKKIKVFTTRLDTVFGVTYVVLAPEHSLVSKLKEKISNRDEIEKYIQETKKKSDLQRMEAKEKTGKEIKGIKAINPFNGEEVPIFVADYVLAQYGTGAVMAVPAHDERDFAFAKNNKLPVNNVIDPDSYGFFAKWNDPKKVSEEQNYKQQEKDYQDVLNGKKVFIYEGKLRNSGNYSELESKQARTKMTEWLGKEGIGKKVTNYKLRDWLVSRQRYWGAPIPIIYCDKCGMVPVPEKDLPVVLPTDVDFKPTGESPLVRSKSFHDVKCPTCGGNAQRESDTMDTFVCSSWYYFRYADPHNQEEFASREKIKKWLSVDIYLGGAEHAVLHLLYARFFTKVLHKLNYIDFDEPFLKLRNQGLILAEDGRKMSKSLGNVVNPDEVVGETGADSLRLFEMFMGSLEDAKPWSTKGIVGARRFLEKAYRLANKARTGSELKANNKIQTLLHKTIKKVTDDIENFRFNTAISAMMILVNELEKEEKISVADYEKFLIILSPFAPHIAEEIWSELGRKESIFLSEWPKHDPALIRDEEINLVVQVNGKVRDSIKTNADISEDEAKELALQSEKVKKFTDGQTIKKIIFVKGKLVNIVI